MSVGGDVSPTSVGEGRTVLMMCRGVFNAGNMEGRGAHADL